MRRKSGFTLIELSIVLVIIGLIVGGVLVGQDLIRGAEIQKLYSDLRMVHTAFNTFQTKYNCISGDCENATTFFGKNTTLCNSDPGAAGSPGTCNGDGNKRILLATETREALKQLMIADLLPYTATSASLPPQMHKWFDGYNIIGTNVNAVNSGTSGNFIQGAIQETNGAFTCDDMQRFDLKYDDGLPNGGVILLFSADPSGGNACTNVANTAYITTASPPFDDEHELFFLLH